MFSGLPVTISSICVPSIIEAVSAIHAITCAFVLTSGAGMSRLAPRIGRIIAVNRRVMRASSPCDMPVGSTWMPPLPPP